MRCHRKRRKQLPFRRWRRRRLEEQEIRIEDLEVNYQVEFPKIFKQENSPSLLYMLKNMDDTFAVREWKKII